MTNDNFGRGWYQRQFWARHYCYCNKNCNYCFALADLPRLADMPLEQALEFIREGYDIGYRDLHLTGGEPTLWPSLFDFLGLAREIGYKSFYINTNAESLREELWRKMAAFKDQLILTVTLNGPREIHDAGRGPGSYDAARRNISRLLEFGLEVHVFTLIGGGFATWLPGFTRDLFAEFPDIRQQTLIQLHRVVDDAHDVAPALLSPEEFVQMVRMVGHIRMLLGVRIGFKEDPLTTATAARLRMDLPRSLPAVRRGGLIMLQNGNLTGLHSIRESAGAYYPGKLKEVLFSEAHEDSFAPDEATCPSCEYVSICRRAGMLRPSRTDWHPEGDLPYCRRVHMALDELCLNDKNDIE